MKQETAEGRSARILNELRVKYPGKKAFDLDGRCMHFVCEVEPTHEHSEYDRAVEVILLTNPHKHLKMTQHYTILSGTLELHVGEEIVELQVGERHTIDPETVHWAKSIDECWVEIFSQPGWTKEDHISVGTRSNCQET
jgi:mannose-6-phosphate isomerase-like protein (cupin superfamily)